MDEILCSAELVTDHLLAVEVLLDETEGGLSRGANNSAEGLLCLAEQIAEPRR